MKRWERENIEAYNYRKWKWLANHMASDHMREMSLKHRRILAREHRVRVISVRRSKRNKAA